MAQNDMLKRYLDAGIAFTKMSRSRAEAIINDLVKTGEVQREQAQQRVDELMDRSRRNTEALVDLVGRERREQLAAMGVATKTELAKLEKRIDALLGGSAKAAPSPAAPAKAAAPAKKAAGKTQAKKTAGAATGASKKAAGATKAATKAAAGGAAKKSTAKKSPATKSTAKKAGGAAKA